MGQSQRAPAGRYANVDRLAEGDEIDLKFGFERLKEGSGGGAGAAAASAPRLGWLLNYLPISMPDESGMEKSGVDLYFLDRQGGNFKASLFFEPYFYLVVSDARRTHELAQHLQKRFEGCRVEGVDKEDLDLPNHLSGRLHRLLRLSFGTVNEMMEVRSALRPTILANQKRQSADDFNDFEFSSSEGMRAAADPLTFVSDMREYDVAYTMRVAIDLDLRVGGWYVVTPLQGSETCSVVWQKDMLELCEPRVLAFDIECEKSPLKFPNAANDRIYMISYMVQVCGAASMSKYIYTNICTCILSPTNTYAYHVTH